MKNITVLITGAGAPGIMGTIYSLKNNDDSREIKIVSVDIRDNVVGKYLSDSFYTVPKYNDKKFVSTILKICKDEGVNVILPQVTKELEVFAANKELFSENGINIAISSEESIKFSNNKYLLLKEFSKLGYDQGKFEIINDKEDLHRFAELCGYPKKRFVLKIPISNGMRGLRIVRDKKVNLNEFINEKPNGVYASIEDIEELLDQSDGALELLAMEYFSGPEYSVDVYRSPLSGKVVAVPRIRSIIRTGITFEGEIVKNDEMEEMSERLANSLNLQYCFGFQFKLDEFKEIRLLESNPRIQGTMIMSVLAGANMIYWAVKESLGEEVNFDNVHIDYNAKFKRYWGGMLVSNDKVQKLC